ncbi:hypothetical protein Bca4012_028866 [Brassica carinata]
MTRATEERNRERESQRVTHRRGIERDTPPRRETTLTRATEEDEPEKRPPMDQGNREREAQRVPQRGESREVERRGDLDRRRDQPWETSRRRSNPPRRGFERERDTISSRQNITQERTREGRNTISPSPSLLSTPVSKRRPYRDLFKQRTGLDTPDKDALRDDGESVEGRWLWK